MLKKILIILSIICTIFIGITVVKAAVGDPVIEPFGLVKVVHTNGSWTMYSPKANTDFARGNALLTAVNAAVDQDSVFICNAVYDVGSAQTNFLDLSKSSGTGSVDLHGCSEQNTIVKGYPLQATGALISIGASSTVTDLEAWNYGTTSIRIPIGRFQPTFDITGFRLHNIITKSISDGFYLVQNSSQIFSGIISNLDCTSNWDCNKIDDAPGSNITYYGARNVVIASSTVSNSNTSMILTGGGTVNLYDFDTNTQATTTARSILCSQSIPNVSTINYYSGKVITSTSRLGTGATVTDLAQSGAFCTLNVSPNVIYNNASTTGTITRIPLWGGDIADVASKIGIGTSSPWALLSVNATTTNNGIPLFAVATTTGSATTTAFIVDSNGNAGIGTTSPASQLGIAGSWFTTATSTGMNGINLTSGCFSISNTCVSGTPAGSNTQVQYNNSGVFGASSNLTFNSGTNLLTTVNASTTDFSSSNFIGLGTVGGNDQIQFVPSYQGDGFPHIQFFITAGSPRSGFIDGFNVMQTLPGSRWSFEDHGGFTQNQYFQSAQWGNSGNQPLKPFMELSGEQGQVLIGTSTCSNSCTNTAMDAFLEILNPVWSANNRVGNTVLKSHKDFFEFASSTGATDGTVNDILVGTNGGLIGIGTSTPYATLSVQSGSNTGDAFAVATSSGKTVFGIDNDGHKFSSGPAPIVSSCGTGSPTIVGDDQGGTITTGTGATSCTITFSKAYRNTPYVTYIGDNSIVITSSVTTLDTTHAVISVSGAGLTGGLIWYGFGYHQ